MLVSIKFSGRLAYFLSNKLIVDVVLFLSFTLDAITMLTFKRMFASHIPYNLQ